jgi:polar amino acid transport system substrate-binding protein
MKKFIISLIILSEVVFCSFVMADEILLVADEWCPFNCRQDSEKKGFMVEIAEYSFAKKGHTVKYVTVPWKRAIFGTRNGQYDGIIGAGKYETPDFIFPGIEIGLSRHTFYVKKGATWKYSDIKSLENITLGVINNYSYGNLFNEYIEPNKNNPEKVQIVSGENALALNIKKLQIGRIDAVIEDQAVFKHYLHRTKTQNEFLEAGLAYIEAVYISFSPQLKKANEYADILTGGMKELRKSGKLAKILKKYGLDDWRQ